MRHTLMVLVTDGEEAGLMGAAALVTDPEVSNRLRAYLNLEALGPSGPSVLFETGDGWLVDAWRRASPWPRGTSYATEIYKRLPNDTDFTILNRRGIPGLNFATIGSSAVYHTARDTADRIPARTLRHSVENTIAIMRELDREDLAGDASGDRVFFDALNLMAFSYRMITARALTAVALLLALGAWVRLIVGARRHVGILALVMTSCWSLVSATLLSGLMLGLTSAFRAIRASFHPWDANPDRLLALFAITIGAGICVLMHLGQRLPKKLRGSNDPLSVWIVALPVWAVLTAALELGAPAASYLWTLPLLCASACLLMTPLTSTRLLRLSSFVILAMVAVFWVRDTLVLHNFIVEQMARLPLTPPAFVYILLPIIAGLMFVPPSIASFSGASSWRAVRPWSRRVWPIAASLTAIVTLIAPTYTFDRPLRRAVRYVHDGASGRAVWEVGSLESALEIEPTANAPRGWRRVEAPFLSSLPVTGTRMPFLHRADAEPKAFPGSVQVQATRDGDAISIHLSVIAPGEAEILFTLPATVLVDGPTLAGRIVRGHWIASYGAPPPSGVTLSFRLRAADLGRLGDAAVIVEVPHLSDGPGWQGLPAWLPQDRAVWAASAAFIRPVASSIQRAAAASRPGRRSSITLEYVTVTSFHVMPS